MNRNENSSDNSVTTMFRIPLLPISDMVLLPHNVIRVRLDFTSPAIKSSTYKLIVNQILNDMKNNKNGQTATFVSVFPLYPTSKDLFKTGCLAKILKIYQLNMNENTNNNNNKEDDNNNVIYSLLLRGTQRCSLISSNILESDPIRSSSTYPSVCDAHCYNLDSSSLIKSASILKLCNKLINDGKLLFAMFPNHRSVALGSIFDEIENNSTEQSIENSITKIADLIAGTFEEKYFMKQKLAILSCQSSQEVILKVLVMIQDKFRSYNIEVYDRSNDPYVMPNIKSQIMDNNINKKSSNDHKRFRNPFNRMNEMNDEDDEDDLTELKKRWESMTLPPHVEQAVSKEFKRISKMNSSGSASSSPEYIVSKTYLETIFDVPWSNYSKNIDVTINNAKLILDNDHYGLDQVKRRIIQFIAVLILANQFHQNNEQQISTSHFVNDRNESDSDLTMNNSIKLNNQSKPSNNNNNDSNNNNNINNNNNNININKHINSKNKAKSSPTILCLLGPPGVGKTSLGKSIASALGRKFERISLGGIHDEAEIRGHRRTYIGSIPGAIIQALKRVKCMNPVILLDEIDKLSGGRSSGGGVFRGGDPYAALLEVLDPDQNDTFMDHYLGLSVDLSQVVFIATANYMEGISGPLLDRMELIQLSGYTIQEKLIIAEKYLIPKQIKSNFISNYDIKFHKDVATDAVSNDASASTILDATSQVNINENISKRNYIIDQDYVMRVLGQHRYKSDDALKEITSGISTGLAWTSTGGELLFIESCCFFNEPLNATILSTESDLIIPFLNDNKNHNKIITTHQNGLGRVAITGNMGKVMLESCTLAMAWIRSNITFLESFYGKEVKISRPFIGSFISSLHSRAFHSNIHIHIPAGAIPKDGPSAGC
eukprot:gene15676-21205_t